MPARYPSIAPLSIPMMGESDGSLLTITLATPIQLDVGTATSVKLVLKPAGGSAVLCVKFFDASGVQIDMRDVAWA